MLLAGGMQAGWNPRGKRIGEKSSLLSEDSASLSSEDRCTTACCKEVMCMQRAYESHHRLGWFPGSIPQSFGAA